MGMTGIITPDIFKGFPVQAFFTTKRFHGEVDRLRTELHAETAYLPLQKHTDKITILAYDLEPKVADAVVTNRRGLVIGIKVADCVPVLLFDKKETYSRRGPCRMAWDGRWYSKKNDRCFKRLFSCVSSGYYHRYWAKHKRMLLWSRA